MKLRNTQFMPLIVYAAVFMMAACCISFGGILNREELQNINKMFEARAWWQWHPISLQRLNPRSLWQYHQQHEIPREVWAWDYTISWLLENNHRAPTTKIVVFNHLPEDEPPVEAVADHPWMSELLHQPLHRATVAKFIRTLAKSGARAIILDNDFPQYSSDDATLAKAMHDAASGVITGKPVPVLMVRSVYRQSSSNVAVAQSMTQPSGVLDELQKLEPTENVAKKYTGTACLYTDADQVVRRCLLRVPSVDEGDSVVLKASSATGLQLPDILDIDFISPPGSGIIPVRSWSYLLDPDRVAALMNPPSGSRDVNVHNATVIIGDGITDNFNAPFTNVALSQMSGSEILAQALDTLNAKTWPHRLTDAEKLAYIALLSLSSMCTVAGFRAVVRKLLRRQLTFGAQLAVDAVALIAILCGATLLAYALFAYGAVVVPITAVQAATVLAFIACTAWEREQHRAALAAERLAAAERRHDSELRIEKAQAQLREVFNDRERRREFIRRINHDLKAPLTVINWNLSKLRTDGLQTASAPEKIERIVRSSDRLYDLLSDLTQTYDNDNSISRQDLETSTCQLNAVLTACVSLGQSLAEMDGSSVVLKDVPQDAIAIFDGVDLSRVCDNLIKNAIVHNPSGVCVTVSVESSDSNYVIRIADNGKGIPDEHLSKIFDPEYRVNPHDGKGTGLGLDIVKSLVEQTGGSVSVASTVGEGTTFLIALRKAENMFPDERTEIEIHSTPRQAEAVVCD